MRLLDVSGAAAHTGGSGTGITPSANLSGSDGGVTTYSLVYAQFRSAPPSSATRGRSRQAASSIPASMPTPTGWCSPASSPCSWATAPALRPSRASSPGQADALTPLSGYLDLVDSFTDLPGPSRTFLDLLGPSRAFPGLPSGPFSLRKGPVRAAQATIGAQG
jgi:hypothetical protein